MLDETERQTLIDVAAEAIAHGLRTGAPPTVRAADYPAPLRQARASFVTLERRGELRGCIGALEPRMPLVEDVALHAYAAAFQDPRFPPLTEAELDGLDIHISVLKPPEPLAVRTEQEALAALRPGVDGVILEDRGRRATFLPAVWKSLPEPADFLRHLKLKAGLPQNYWSDTLRLSRYSVEAFNGRPTRARSGRPNPAGSSAH